MCTITAYNIRTSFPNACTDYRVAGSYRLDCGFREFHLLIKVLVLQNIYACSYKNSKAFRSSLQIQKPQRVRIDPRAEMGRVEMVMGSGPMQSHRI